MAGIDNQYARIHRKTETFQSLSERLVLRKVGELVSLFFRFLGGILEPEKKTTLSARYSLSALGLLGILVSFFSILRLLSKSKINQQRTKSIHPHQSPYINSDHVNNSILPNVPPPPAQETNSERPGNDTPNWKKFTEISIAIGTLGLLLVNILLWLATKESSDTARDALHQSAAQITIEDLRATVIPDPTLFSVEVRYKLRNAGNSIANEINASIGSGFSRNDGKDADIKLSSTPDPEGPSLAAGISRDYVSPQGGIDKRIMESGNYDFFVDIAVSYRDVFERPRIRTDCIHYMASKSEFYPCQHRHQND